MHIIRKPIVGRVITGLSKPRFRFPDARPLAGDHYLGNREPDLAEMIDDPLIGRLMASDGVDRDSLESLLEAARQGLFGNGSAVAKQFS